MNSIFEKIIRRKYWSETKKIIFFWSSIRKSFADSSHVKENQVTRCKICNGFFPLWKFHFLNNENTPKRLMSFWNYVIPLEQCGPCLLDSSHVKENRVTRCKICNVAWRVKLVEAENSLATSAKLFRMLDYKNWIFSLFFTIYFQFFFVFFQDRIYCEIFDVST